MHPVRYPSRPRLPQRGKARWPSSRRQPTATRRGKEGPSESEPHAPTNEEREGAPQPAQRAAGSKSRRSRTPGAQAQSATSRARLNPTARADAPPKHRRVGWRTPALLQAHRPERPSRAAARQSSSSSRRAAAARSATACPRIRPRRARPGRGGKTTRWRDRQHDRSSFPARPRRRGADALTTARARRSRNRCSPRAASCRATERGRAQVSRAEEALRLLCLPHWTPAARARARAIGTVAATHSERLESHRGSRDAAG